LALCVIAVVTTTVGLAFCGCSQSPEKKTTPAPEAKQEPAAPAAPAKAEGAPAAPEQAAAKPAEPSAAGPKPPLGLPPLPVPADNPMTPEKVELGKLLYFDTRMSKDGTISCATCHDPKMAWAEHTAVSTGVGHQHGARNSPTVINAAYATSQFWDEMGHTMTAVVAHLSTIPDYQQRFKKVFGTGVTKEGFAKAIAAFERTVLSGDSPYDRFVAGDQSAMSDAQKRGWETFREQCATCHTQPLMSNYRFFNAGVGSDKPNADVGRMKVTGKESDRGKFRVPALRNVADTAPYFHDGSAAKLEDAVALMAAGGKNNPNLSEMLKSVREANLGPKEQKDLVEFLGALSGKYPVVEPPPLPK
jgi:cytochrome c peroxidase